MHEGARASKGVQGGARGCSWRPRQHGARLLRVLAYRRLTPQHRAPAARLVARLGQRRRCLCELRAAEPRLLHSRLELLAHGLPLLSPMRRCSSLLGCLLSHLLRRRRRRRRCHLGRRRPRHRHRCRHLLRLLCRCPPGRRPRRNACRLHLHCRRRRLPRRPLPRLHRLLPRFHRLLPRRRHLCRHLHHLRLRCLPRLPRLPPRRRRLLLPLPKAPLQQHL